MVLYSILELLILILLIIHRWLFNDKAVLDLLTFLPIITTAIYMFTSKKIINKKDKLLYVALLIAVLGDIFLIYINNIYGIYSFLLIQLFYLYYFKGNKTNKRHLITIAILVLGMCLALDSKSLYFLGAIYVIIFIHNLYYSIKNINNSKKKLFILFGFLCLAVCDTNVFFVSLIKEYNWSIVIEKICFTLEWIFYISFQVIVSYAITKVNDD